jgi:hypothetical protein
MMSRALTGVLQRDGSLRGEPCVFVNEWSATRKLSCNRVREVIEANRRGTWTRLPEK